jgi:hypothetical protein
MRPTTACSLQFNSTFGEYALLDDSGDLLEAGKLRMTRAAMWNRFAALTPAVIAVNYDPRFLWAVEMLTQLGHAVVFSGGVPELLRDELTPLVGPLRGTALLCQSKSMPDPSGVRVTSPSNPAHPGIFFLVDGDGERIIDAHYIVGPVTAQSRLNTLSKTIPQTAEATSAQDSACRLYQLLATGMIALPDLAFAQTTLKGNAVAAA